MPENSFSIGEITELPFGFPGRVFRSPMPFSAFDSKTDLIEVYRQYDISVIVLLIEDQECFEKSGKHLRGDYLRQGFEVIYLPIPDFTLPERRDLEVALEAALKYAQEGKNLVVHCHAGIGRTGLFLACLAERALRLSGKDAIDWLRQYIPGAVETPEQSQMVLALSYKEDEIADNER
jgi:protein tyrosine phosphatase domain-containing protein 1